MFIVGFRHFRVCLFINIIIIIIARRTFYRLSIKIVFSKLFRKNILEIIIIANTVILRFTGPRFTVSLDITCLWCSNQPALITPFVQALAKKEGADKKRPADIRIMGSQYTSLQCWFFETWTEYNECQSDYREKCKEKLTRQIQISESARGGGESALE